MEIPDFINQFTKIKEKEIEQKTWEFWLTNYPYFNEKTFVSYEEMLNKMKQTENKENVNLNGLYVDQCFF